MRGVENFAIITVLITLGLVGIAYSCMELHGVLPHPTARLLRSPCACSTRSLILLLFGASPVCLKLCLGVLIWLILQHIPWVLLQQPLAMRGPSSGFCEMELNGWIIAGAYPGRLFEHVSSMKEAHGVNPQSLSICLYLCVPSRCNPLTCLIWYVLKLEIFRMWWRRSCTRMLMQYEALPLQCHSAVSWFLLMPMSPLCTAKSRCTSLSAV